MKKSHLISATFSCSYFFILCIFLISCKCNNKQEAKSIIKQWCAYPYSEIPRDTSIILWRKPGVTAADFELWKTNHHLSNGRPACRFCNDGDLELYEGVSIELFGGTGGTSTCTGSVPCKPHGGGDDTVAFCYNIPIKLDTLRGEKYDTLTDTQIPSEADLTGPVVNIGVFDTGVDPKITSKYTTPLPGPCDPAAALGWDFANNDANTQDDFPTLHGTKVAKFIVDQVKIYHNQKVNIIPVKIFDSNGQTSLFKILCAFSYAQHSGIKIINASFGFYWHDLNNPPALFCDYIKTHLTDNGILLIASAGNRDITEDNDVTTSGLVLPADLRDLEKHPCYPASLAGQPGYGNVVTVTTVFSPQDKISPQQNYSKTIVDIGVDGDQHYILPASPVLPPPIDEYGFQDPLVGPPTIALISGSSYATPIITGRIASFYDILTSGMGTSINKANLISGMQSKGLVKTSMATVIPAHIKNGVYAPRAR